MTRFLSFALPLLVVLVALFNLGVELLGLDPELGPLIGWTEGRTGLPGVYVLGSWLLEALGLTALYLLVASPQRSPWLSGLLTGWIAWVFRGPLLVLAAVGFGGLPGGPWWNLSLRWLVLYTLAGILLATIARLTRFEDGDRTPVAPFPGDAPRTPAPPAAPSAGAAPPVGAGPQPPDVETPRPPTPAPAPEPPSTPDARSTAEEAAAGTDAGPEAANEPNPGGDPNRKEETP